MYLLPPADVTIQKGNRNYVIKGAKGGVRKFCELYS